jgi:predicted SAM-dependent methyltransferase
MIKATLKKGRDAAKKPFLAVSQAYYSIAGNKVECNLCHQKANRFKSNPWHKFTNCPNCGSAVRNRLMYAALTDLDEFNEKKLIDGKRVLHFAPEQGLRSILRKKAGKYLTADYLTEGYDYGDIDYNLDITDMKKIGDKSIDCLIASDVLEHVYNVKNGLSEIHRVLADGGWCILTVPQKDHLDKTIEDITLTDPKERERLFGQDDHFRIFGFDFKDMMEDAGFKVSVIDEQFFDKDKVERYVLFPPVLSDLPLACNYRKIYFGQKV